MANPVAKGMAAVELLIAALLAIIAIPSIRDLFASGSRRGEWAPMIVVIAITLSASFTVAGVALLHRWRARWLAQVIPCATIVAVWIFLWWADRVP